MSQQVATGRATVAELRVFCRLRELREPLSLLQAQAATGIHRGTLSQLERIERLPRVAHIAQLEQVYGPEEQWYGVRVR